MPSRPPGPPSLLRLPLLAVLSLGGALCFGPLESHAASLRLVEAHYELPAELLTAPPDQPPRLSLLLRLLYTGEPNERFYTERAFREEELSAIAIQSPSAESLNHQYRIATHRSTLSWSGFLDAQGEAEVVVRAQVAHGLIGTRGVNSLDIEWLGDWPLPVERLELRIALPTGYQPRSLEALDAFQHLDRGTTDTGSLELYGIFTTLQPYTPLRGRVLLKPGLVEDLGPIRYTYAELAGIVLFIMFVLAPVGWVIGRRLTKEHLKHQRRISAVGLPPTKDQQSEAVRVALLTGVLPKVLKQKPPQPAPDAEPPSSEQQQEDQDSGDNE